MVRIDKDLSYEVLVHRKGQDSKPFSPSVTTGTFVGLVTITEEPPVPCRPDSLVKAKIVSIAEQSGTCVQYKVGEIRDFRGADFRSPAQE